MILGRSNAINIAERLGLPVEILNNARELYGAASAEINEVFGFGLVSISRLVVHKDTTKSLPELYKFYSSTDQTSSYPSKLFEL